MAAPLELGTESPTTRALRHYVSMPEPERSDYDEVVLRLLRAGSPDELQRSGLVAEPADSDRIEHELAPLWDAESLHVTETRVNGARVDVRVHSGDGRAWLAVLWVDRDQANALVDVTVYERPVEFRGAQPGTVIVLNGPSSAGKSSLMAAFADAAPEPWACIDEPVFGRLANRFLAWPATAGPVVEGFLAGLAASAHAGNQLIVSTGGIAQSRFRDALDGVRTVYVGLDAPLDVLLERQLTQADKFGGLAEESVGIHEGWEYDLRIDTASNPPTAAAQLLSDFIR